MIFVGSPSISRIRGSVRLACLGSTCDRRPGKTGEKSGSQDAGAGEMQKIGADFLARFEKKENGPFFLGGEEVGMDIFLTRVGSKVYDQIKR